ncbi:Phosphatidate phosphatase APP1 [Belliella buryatensis]|uniref:Phosphatidate phosphatase APP1 n=1 Tax=Belliella buryatensis TaxID=1500549 RepID=A0A239B131_9BACT|nr:phosphatase domain-containing protein [Belliella buryatensis]SNS01321.1 Phosphatidate phosphatase APP1 [Belliella buryatensis]
MVKKTLLTFLYRIKVSFSKIKLKFGIKTGLVKSVIIVPYKGFGSREKIYLIGRVLKDRGIGLSEIGDSRWKNFTKMYKRFMSWEIPKVKVCATLGEDYWVTETDDEGYFEFFINPKQLIQHTSPWISLDLELIDHVLPNQGKVTASASIFIPTKEVEYGIISDIDDTIVPTGATRIWEMLKTTFLGNAHSRIPFEGVSAFYQALEKGADGKENNPMFYVSSSPWNLYDFLTEMMSVHHIPLGPLMLRDLGLSREQFISGSHFDHKLSQVEKIFELVPDIPFILIGDSGQHDPEIYLQVIKDYPGRVKMIYIRHVSEKRRQKVLDIKTEMKSLGVEILLIEDTIIAANHALKKGWIRAEDIQIIINYKNQDEINNS